MAVELYQQPGTRWACRRGKRSPAAKLDRTPEGRSAARRPRPEKAAEVFKHLHYDEIESLSLEMAKLQHVEPRSPRR